MDNKKLKKIQTDLAAGHISEKEAQDLMKDEKVAQIKPDKEFEGKKSKDQPKHTRKRSNKSREVK